MKCTRIFDIIPYQRQRFDLPKSMARREDGKWPSYSSSEVLDQYNSVAQALLNAQLLKGDTILTIPQSAMPSMVILDLAAQSIGLLNVVVHSTFTREQLRHVIEEANPKIIFYGNDAIAEYASEITTDIPSFIVTDEASSEYQNEFSTEPDLGQLAALRADILEDDLSMIIYTSGSSGVPKGVKLTHKNIMSNLSAVMSLLPVGPKSRVLSYLPYSHILERAAVYMYMQMGMEMYSVPDITELGDSFKEVRPHFTSAVPRIIEKMLDGVQDYRDGKGLIKQKMIGWILRIGLNYEPYKKFKPHYSLYMLFAKYFILGKLRKALGGKLVGIAVGGAHLRPELAQFLDIAGIKVREGYGMTETAPIITMNRFEPGLYKYGSVGLPLSNVQIMIAEPDDEGVGEVRVKGPNITQGYFKRPQETEALFDSGGWLRTGDVGSIDEKGFLYITDRAKDIFKTSSGKYVAPALLEQHFRSSFLVNQILILGFQKPEIAALIYPNYEALKKWADKENVHWTSEQYMAHNVKIKAKLQAEVDRLNATLPKYQWIKKFFLVHEEWSTDNGLLSASLKPMRKAIQEKYGKVISELYEIEAQKKRF